MFSNFIPRPRDVDVALEADFRVAELIISQTRIWREDLIRNLFIEEDA